jgi:thymidine kinase
MPQGPRDGGWIEVICGSMFSGQTEELIRRLKRALNGQQKVQVFKPAFDDRYDELKVVSHSQLALVATPVQRGSEIVQQLRPNTEVVGIDEVQFLGPRLTDSTERLVVGAFGASEARCRRCHVPTPVAATPLRNLELL